MQKLAPEEASYYLHLAELNEKQGLPGNAQAEYRSLISLYEKNGLFSEKIDALQKMKALEPDNLNIRVKIAESYLEGAMPERAAEEYREVLDALRERGEYAKIIKLFEIFPSSFADDPELKGVLARALIEAGETEKGIRLLESLLAENGDDAGLLKALAQGYRKRGDLENDRLTLAKLQRCSPGDLEPLEDHIRRCLAEREFVEALEGLEAWKEAFLDAGREEVLRGFYEQLVSELPGDERVTDFLEAPSGLQSNPEASAEVESEGTSEAFPEPEVGDLEDLLVKGAEADIPTGEDEPKEPIGEQEPESDEMEEIPLSFLEQVGGGESCPEDLDPEVGEGETQPEGQPELEGEPALPLDLELELEPLEVESSGGEDEEAFVELELSVDPLEDVLSATPELSGEGLSAEPTGVMGEDDDGEEEILDLGEGIGEAVSGTGDFSSDRDIKDELEEAEFYLQHGLVSEAEQVCRRVLERAPDCPEARRILDELEAGQQSAPDARKKRDEFPDPVAELVDPELLSEGFRGDAAGAVETEFFSLEENMSDSQRGVETELALEDTESHYNLGIAYKEMGLVDDAVVEFERAAYDPSRRVACLTLKGICLTEKGSFAQAEEAFKSGLAQPDLTPPEKTSLNYEAGLLYEAWERPLEALDCFQNVADTDLFFRDVGEKIDSLRKALGLDNEAGESAENGRKKKNRVSYV
jgi:tetratricopeptide (TPR) repeat protein